MAYFQCNFYSQVLYQNTNINIIIPTPNSDEVLNNKDSSYFKKGNEYQTIYLLHGAYGDYSDWMRLTSIEHYAQNHKVAVVMPSVTNSFYQDMFRGENYLTYVTKELPEFVRTLFPLSEKREDNFTAGLSMGGYGALKTALSAPEQYCCAISLSGAVDLSGILKGSIRDGENFPFRLNDIFENPDNVENTEADLFYLIKKLKKEGREIPEMFLSCGVDDFVYPYHLTAKKTLPELGVKVHFEEHPGIHDWFYWDKHIQRAMEWLPLKNDVIRS